MKKVITAINKIMTKTKTVLKASFTICLQVRLLRCRFADDAWRLCRRFVGFLAVLMLAETGRCCSDVARLTSWGVDVAGLTPFDN